jgi:hypothetical protein
MTDHSELNIGELRAREQRPGAPAPGDAQEAWRILAQRFRIIWILLATALPTQFLLVWLLGGVVRPDVVLVVTGAVWLTAIGWFGLKVAGFACPRCGKLFYESWYFLKMLRSNCAHCKLPRDAKDVAPAGPDK